MVSRVEPQVAPVASSGLIAKAGDYLFKPRSQNRDQAFREQTIRVTIFVLAVFTVLSLASSVFVFHDEWKPASLQTIQLSALIMCALSAVAIIRQRILLAGVFLVSLFLIAAGGVLALPQEIHIDGLGTAVFMIAILAAALLLPRSVIVWLAIGCTAFMAVGLYLAQPGDPKNESAVWSGALLFIVEGLLLRRLRVEFDNRLGAMSASIKDADEARHQADEANQAKSQFLASMSHELRTPLNAIIGYTEIMLSGMAGTFTEKQTELHTHVQVNARRLLGLINDVLDLAKIEAGAVEVRIVPATPRKFVGEVIDSMQSLAVSKKIYLRLTCLESMPEMVMCDVGKVQQIVTNLIGNAIKFTASGGVDVHLQGYQRDSWQIAVIDTGPGMPPGAASVIFERFRQLDNSDTRAQKGTGLGLAITQGLVDMLGGKVEVTSELGKGSTFTVTLPRGRAEVAPVVVKEVTA